MSAREDGLSFGDKVRIQAVVGRRRRFQTRQGDQVVVGHFTVDVGHGRRPDAALSRYWPTEPELSQLEVIREAGGRPMGLRYQPPDTLVDLVRIPIDVLHVGNTGVVIGRTHRHAGRVTSEGDVGNVWTSTGAVPVFTVAMNSDAQSCIYDVHPDDLEVAA